MAGFSYEAPRQINMAPPTLCIVALLAFQMEVAEMGRPTVSTSGVAPA